MEKTVSLAEKGQLDPPIPPPPPPGEGMSFPQPPYRPQMGQAAQITALAVTPPPSAHRPPRVFSQPCPSRLPPPPAPGEQQGSGLPIPLVSRLPPCLPRVFLPWPPPLSPPQQAQSPAQLPLVPSGGLFFFSPPPQTLLGRGFTLQPRCPPVPPRPRRQQKSPPPRSKGGKQRRPSKTHDRCPFP